MVGAGEEFGKVLLAQAHLLSASLRKVTTPSFLGLEKHEPPSKALSLCAAVCDGSHTKPEPPFAGAVIRNSVR
jgi:hypothetical protein